MIIDEEFVLKSDLTELRRLVFVEDEAGRYRERIIEQIQKIGVEKWFKARGLPTDENSIWKNRYTGTEETLNQQVHHFDNGHLEHNLENEGYYVWENWLPKEIWNDKDTRKDGLLAWC